MGTKKHRNTEVLPILNEDGKYICLTDGSLLPATPEEKVRQGFIAVLMNEYGYPSYTRENLFPI